MYFLTKNLRACSRIIRGVPNSSLYKNGVLNWEYLAKNMSYFLMHPEELKQKLKERDAHMLCQFFDSEDYKQKVSAFLETQSRILTNDSMAGIRRVKYQHVLSCAQPSHKKTKSASQAKKHIQVNVSKNKKKGTIIDHLMKRKTHEESASKEVDVKVTKSEVPRKISRHRTTIMPIFLKKMKKRLVQMDAEEYPVGNKIARRTSNSDEAEPLYAQILHRSNIYQRGLKTLAYKNATQASKEQKDPSDSNSHTGQETEEDSVNSQKNTLATTLTPESRFYKGRESRPDLNQMSINSQKRSNTIIFEGDPSKSYKSTPISDFRSLEEDSPMSEGSFYGGQESGPHRRHSAEKPHTLIFEGETSQPYQPVTVFESYRPEENEHASQTNYYKKQKAKNRKHYNMDSHTLIFDSSSYPIKKPEAKSESIAKEPNTLTFKGDLSRVRGPLTPPKDTYIPEKLYKKYTEDDLYAAQVKNFENDPLLSDPTTFKLSNLPPKLDHVPYRLSRATPKLKDVSLKLNSPSNIHVPLRMSSSSSKLAQKGVTTKLYPRKNFNIGRKSFSELLSVEPVTLKPSKVRKIRKAQSELDDTITIEVLTRPQVKRRNDKGTGKGDCERDSVTPFQTLVDKVYKSRSLDIGDNLERRSTMVAILKNRGNQLTKKATHIEMPSLFQKVKMGSKKTLKFTANFLYLVSYEIFHIVLFVAISFCWFVITLVKKSSQKDRKATNRYSATHLNLC